MNWFKRMWIRITAKNYIRINLGGDVVEFFDFLPVRYDIDNEINKSITSVLDGKEFIELPAMKQVGTIEFILK